MTTGASHRTGEWTTPAIPTAARRADPDFHESSTRAGRVSAENAAASAGRPRGPHRRLAGTDRQLVGRVRADLLKQIRSGESGALPVIIGLVVDHHLLPVKSSVFLSAGNLVNLMTQPRSSSRWAWPRSSCCCSARSTWRPASPPACGAVIALYLVANELSLVGRHPGLPGGHRGLRGAPGVHHHPAAVALVRGYAGRLPRSCPAPLLFLIDSTGSIGNGGVIRLNSNVLNDIEAGALSADRQLDRDDRAGGAGRPS